MYFVSCINGLTEKDTSSKCIKIFHKLDIKDQKETFEFKIYSHF